MNGFTASEEAITGPQGYLAAMDSEIVHLEMKSALSPCVLKPEGDPGFLCVVMPMKV